MTAWLLLAVGVLQGVPIGAQSAQYELQGIYDAIGRLTATCGACVDLDTTHAVLATPDWVSIDADGTRRTWDQVQVGMSDVINTPLDVTTNGAVVVGRMTVEQTVDDALDGGERRSHVLSCVESFRDTWVKTPDWWKQRIHQTLGPSRIRLDGKPLSSLHTDRTATCLPEVLHQHRDMVTALAP